MAFIPHSLFFPDQKYVGLVNPFMCLDLQQYSLTLNFIFSLWCNSGV